MNCFTVGNFETSVPISLRITKAVASSIPSMTVKSTPAIWKSF